jgi:catechol 2,3-dioxygenase-like lactoylglutathione lyase family enzyme
LQKSLQFYNDVFGLDLQFVTDAAGPELSQTVMRPDSNITLAFLRFSNTFV